MAYLCTLGAPCQPSNAINISPISHFASSRIIITKDKRSYFQCKKCSLHSNGMLLRTTQNTLKCTLTEENIKNDSKVTTKGVLAGKYFKIPCLETVIKVLGFSAVGSGVFSSAPSLAITMSELPSLMGSMHGPILADLDPSLSKIGIDILGPLFASFNILFIVRIVMTWYPQIPLGKFPYVIAYLPTEPFLSPTRKVIPPVSGVDVSPVVWFAIISFLNEILLGQQGLLVLLSQQNP